MRPIPATLALFATAATFAACTEQGRLASPTMEPRQSAATAAESIAEAACDREQRCGNIGPGRDHASPAACAQSNVTPLQVELGDPDCAKSGVGASDLTECVEEINSRPCGALALAGYWEEMIECGSGDLCLD